MVVDLLGKEWDSEELEKKMIDDEFYYGYMAKASLSSSACKSLLTNPKEYSISLKKKQEDTDAFMKGRLVHQTILEPEKTFEYNIVDCKDKRAKEWKDAVKNNIPNTITRKDYDYLKRLCYNTLCNKHVKKLLKDCSFEVPKVGYIAGFLFRAKADALGFLGSGIIDLKTTSDISKFKYNAKYYGYDMQCYIYCKLFDVSWEEYKFLVIDKTNGSLGVFDVSERFYLEGERKVMEAIENYKAYFRDRTKDVEHYITIDTI